MLNAETYEKTIVLTDDEKELIENIRRSSDPENMLKNTLNAIYHFEQQQISK